MKRYLCVRWFLMTFTILFLGSITYELHAQQQQSESKVSFTLNTGLTYGAAGNSSFGPFAGKFNVSSFQQPIYGGSFQYAFTPAWSIDTALQFGEFKNQFDDAPPFQNDFFYLTVKGVTNLNNLLDLNWGGSRVVNPYLSFGLGMMRSRIEAVDLDSEDLSLMGTGGAGLSFYLFRAADLFVQYHYHVVGSDLLDGFSGDGGSDHFAAINAGLRINFGRSDSKLISWPPSRERRVREPAPRPVIADPVPEPEPEPETVSDPSESEILEEERRAAELQREEEERALELRREEEQRIEEMRREEERRAAELLREEERRALELRREEEQRAERMASQLFTDQPAAGHYIQIYSFRSQTSAENMRDDLISILDELAENGAQRVVIHRYGNYHRVLIGPFERFTEARRVQQELSNRYRDAFVITYPRQTFD